MIKNNRLIRLILGVATLFVSLTFLNNASAVDVVFAEDRPDLRTLDPRITQSRHEEMLIVNMFDQLIAADSNGNKYPGLATSWDVSSDGLHYTFELRDDVTFHDGTKFNAAAVKITFDSIVDPETGSQGAIDILGPYASSEVISEYKVRVNFSRRYGSALTAFTETELSIISPKALNDLGNEGFGMAPVGTGPFMFKSWEANKKVEMVNNPDYNWAPEYMDGSGPSKVENLTYRLIKDTSTRVAALESGEVDIAELVPPLDMRRFDSSGELNTIAGIVSGLPYSAFLNTSVGHFQDIKVRQAFFYSLNRVKMTSDLFFGYAEAAFGPISSATPSYWKGNEGYYQYDAAKAEALLEEAGWKMGSNGVREKNGETLSVFFPCLLEPDTCVAIQAYANKVGFDVNVEVVMKARQDELIFANGYDMMVIRWVSLDPGVLIIPFHSRNIPAPGKFKFNWSRYSTPELDQLLEDAESAETQETKDDLYMQIQKIIMDQAIFLAIHDQVQTIAYNPNLEGIKFANGNWQLRMYDVREK
jgi:peptide/nickel transport system substrate-binding protein